MVQNADLPLAGLVGFEAAARHLRFARAAAELRITPTAMSKLIGQLEERLGTRLFHRTTRSVALTEAGQRLAASVGPALGQLRTGVEEAGSAPAEAAGTLRINTSYVAWKTLVEPHLHAFLRQHPHVKVEASLDNRAGDIVASGFDVGIRPGRGLQRDVVGVQLSPPLRLVVVGAASYLARAGRPRTPSDLLGHDCIRQRLSPERWFEWTLLDGRKTVTTEVQGRVIVDEMRSALSLAVEGIGLAYVFESFAKSELAAGNVEIVLQKHALPREAFFLYYPSRKQVPPKLRAFSGFFRAKNR
jgi:DNA-binding transcriptional LysR family regulator